MKLSLHDFPAVTELAKRLRVEPYQLRRFRNACYKQGATLAAAREELPAAVRAEFANRLQDASLTLVRRLDSVRDGATKLAFRTTDGKLIESVILRIRSGRTSLCLSTQVGCAGGCSFCATGALGFVRDLTRDEILDQVLLANRLLVQDAEYAVENGMAGHADDAGNRDEPGTCQPLPGGEGLCPDSRSVPRASVPVPRIRNLVFMGMGEPFHNEANLNAALDLLLSPAAFNVSARKITVSTVGIPEAMKRFAARYPDVCLALSLHSAQEHVRRRLVPLAARYPLTELRQTLLDLSRCPPGIVTKPRNFVEYLLLEGVNDGPEARQALVQFLAGIPAHINLIPLNASAATGDLRGVAESARRAFARDLRAAGFPVTLRYSLGSDIAAACGQLAGNDR